MTNSRRKDGASLMTVVAAALVNDAGEVLVQQRPTAKAHGGLWEFPGGKVEAGETPEDALVRELAEELGIAVEAAALTPVVFATEPQGERHLLLLLYRVRDWKGDVRPLDADAIAWVLPRELSGWAMPPADRPLARALERPD